VSGISLTHAFVGLTQVNGALNQLVSFVIAFGIVISSLDGSNQDNSLSNVTQSTNVTKPLGRYELAWAWQYYPIAYLLAYSFDFILSSRRDRVMDNICSDFELVGGSEEVKFSTGTFFSWRHALAILLFNIWECVISSIQLDSYFRHKDQFNLFFAIIWFFTLYESSVAIVCELIRLSLLQSATFKKRMMQILLYRDDIFFYASFSGVDIFKSHQEG
jgi:hypothetical protein